MIFKLLIFNLKARALLFYAIMALFSVLVLLPCKAEALGKYIGAGIGYNIAFKEEPSDYSDNPFGYEFMVKHTTREDYSSYAEKFFFGFDIHPNFAVEIGYIDFGKGKINIHHNFPEMEIMAYFETVSFKIDGIFASFIAQTKLNDKFSLFVKGGLNFWEVDYTLVALATRYLNSQMRDGYYEENIRGIGFLFGTGVKMKATEKISLRLELEVYLDVGRGTKLDHSANAYYSSGFYPDRVSHMGIFIDSMDIYVSSLSVQYNF